MVFYLSQMSTKFAVVFILLLLGVLQAPARAVVLQAEIEHSDHIQPLEQALMPGQVFDNHNLPQASSAPQNHWYMVPVWLAGTWHKDTQTNYFRYNYASKTSDTTTRVVEAKSDGVWGTQQDGTGQVWQYDPVPFYTSVDAGTQTVIQLVRSSEPVAISDQQFVRKSIQTQINVDKATRRIISVESGEQITSYIPEQNGLIKRDTSAKVFDRDGMPLVLGKSFAYETRVQPFYPHDTFEGRDMKSLFKQFLDSQRSTSSLP